MLCTEPPKKWMTDNKQWNSLPWHIQDGLFKHVVHHHKGALQCRQLKSQGVQHKKLCCYPNISNLSLPGIAVLIKKTIFYKCWKEIMCLCVRACMRVRVNVCMHVYTFHIFNFEPVLIRTLCVSCLWNWQLILSPKCPLCVFYYVCSVHWATRWLLYRNFHYYCD